MSRLKLFILSLLLISFVFCTFSSTSYAQIGPGGDTIGAGGNMPSNGPNTIGPGGDMPTDSEGLLSDGADVPSDGLLTLTPLNPIGPRSNVHSYEVFNATPGGEVFIIRGYEEGSRRNLICIMINLDIVDFDLENILVADEFGYAASTINVSRIGPRDVETLYMQAIDVEECVKSNLTEYDL